MPVDTAAPIILPPPELFSVRGKTVLITGASSGLGEHFAELLGAHQARVILAARRRQRLDALAARLQTAGVETAVVVMDVTDIDSVRAGFDSAQTQLGIAEIVVNNAGTAIDKPALQVTEDDWNTVVGTNLTGAWRVATEAATRMVTAEVSGSIINILSILSFGICTGLSSYAAAKAGLLQLTRSHALEFAHHRIRVNGIAPGYFRTEINDAFFDTVAGHNVIQHIPQRRIGKASDLDGALLLLASDASRYMTGATITVDGGHLCSGI